MKYDIGVRIREYREKSNLSQKEFAKLIGVSNSRVSNWEQGINRPDLDILSKICIVLSVSADDLLNIEHNHDGKAEQVLLGNFNNLNDNGQYEANKRVEELTYIDKYKRRRKYCVIDERDNISFLVAESKSEYSTLGSAHELKEKMDDDTKQFEP